MSQTLQRMLESSLLPSGPEKCEMCFSLDQGETQQGQGTGLSSAAATSLAERPRMGHWIWKY